MTEAIQIVPTAPATFTFENETYTLAPLTAGPQAKFSTWLERKAWESVRRARSFLSPEEHAVVVAQVSRDVSSGVYNFAGRVANNAMVSFEGMKRLILISAQVNHPALDEDFIDRLAADQESLGKAAEVLSGLIGGPPAHDQTDLGV